MNNTFKNVSITPEKSSKTDIQAVADQNNARNTHAAAETNQSNTLLKKQEVKVKELTKQPLSNVKKAGNEVEKANKAAKEQR